MNILAIIPARGGSKGLPRKNLLKIGEKSLVGRSIESAKNSKLLSKIIFSSDDDEIIDEAKKYNIKIPFKRPHNLATDTASTFSVIKHAVDWLNENENWSPEIIVILQPTTPFRKGSHIDDTIKLLLDKDSDAAITVREPDYPPHWMLNLNQELILKNIIRDGNKFMRRQDTPTSYQPSGMVYAFKEKILHEIDTLFPYGDTRGLIVNRDDSINIDTYIDYLVALKIWESKNNN